MALLSGGLLLWWVAQFMNLVAPLLSDVCGVYCAVCPVMKHLTVLEIPRQNNIFMK
jgi:hypothetical protein